MTILDPVSASNLTVYLLQLPRSRPATRQKSSAPPVEFVALEQAVAAGHVVVHESGSQERVRLEVLTSKFNLFLPAGEIICGGEYHKALAGDLLVPAPRFPPHWIYVPTFCVEERRWEAFDAGQIDVLTPAGQLLPSRKLKLALRIGTQDEVYRETARLTDDVIDILSYCGAESTPRLPLHTLIERLEADWLAPYTIPLLHLAEANEEATGAVFVLNGKLNSADLYATPTLFRQMWPKLLWAMAVEALIEQEDEAAWTGKLPTKGEVTAGLAGAHARRAARHTDIVTKRTHRRIRSIGTTICFETLDEEQGGLCVHEIIVSNE